MNVIYSIIGREINVRTGEISVKILKKGIQEEVTKDLTYLKLRSMLNQELSYYLVLQDNEKEAIKELKKKIVRESDLYIKI